MHRRTALLAAASAVAVAASFAPFAAAKGFRRHPQILTAETPLGSQSDNIVIPFVVADITRKPVDVEAQYGVDYNADGVITDDEYRIATEDRFDPRNTRLNTIPQVFTTDVDGATHGYVWKSRSDVGWASILKSEYVLTLQGRPVPDPDNPGKFLLATGPDGVSPLFPGVKFRIRTVVHRRTRRHPAYGAWVYTEDFSLDNRHPPSMRIDSVTSGSPVIVNWTAFDLDAEDLNGNGYLDVAIGEDADGDGTLDCARVGVAFDFHIVWEGEDVAAMTDLELSKLQWIECARVPGVGDTDSLDTRPGVPGTESGELRGVCTAPPPYGRHWVFAWDPVSQIGTTWRGFIVRATPFDQTRARGATVYSRTIVYETE